MNININDKKNSYFSRNFGYIVPNYVKEDDPKYVNTAISSFTTTIPFNTSGDGALNVNASLHIQKIIDTVSFQLPAQSFTSSGSAGYFYTVPGSIPAEFRPPGPSSLNFQITVRDNGSSQSANIEITTDGSIKIYSGLEGGNFTFPSSCGWYDFSCSYRVV